MGFITRQGRTLLIAAALMVEAVWLSGCGVDPEEDTGSNCTSAATCKQVTIGNQTWMAENLNINTADSWCHRNSPDSCKKYGRLYTWAAARTACPSGWHLPSRAEWGALAIAAGGTGEYGELPSLTAGDKLKSASGWPANTGTDTYGFSALPGGIRFADNSFFPTGPGGGYWWTSTERDGEKAYYRWMLNGAGTVAEGYQNKSDAFSVRCVTDGSSVTPPVTQPPVTQPTTYTLTVLSVGVGASGSGNYPAGVTMYIDAGTAPEGQEFKYWIAEGVTITGSNSGNPIRFDMPANAVTLTAVFEDKVVNNCTSAATCKSKEMPDGKVWMTENLNIATEDSRCYRDSGSYCNYYGRLYTWNAAMTACPTGWHLPSRVEWYILAKAAGDYTALKSNDTDGYGFSALPGGYWSPSDSSFSGVRSTGRWWTATEEDEIYAYYYSGIIIDKGYALSVRCLENTDPVALELFVDARDGKNYKKTVIGGKTWMAENLNYDTADGVGSWCYGDEDSNCVKYGRLYNWNTAMNGASSSSANPSGVQGICPSGWHLPSRAEWDDLVTTAGGLLTGGIKLKSTSGWNSYRYDGSVIGTDEFGFSALPGGYQHNVKTVFFGDVGNRGIWWTATENGDGIAYMRGMNYNSNSAGEGNGGKDTNTAYSVRCVED